ncbi:hypothetical protein ONZ45_g16054 [Pleurotus djamor]|nr:hypothetical protein ONZ45_g16054 [Pleurotus djamor]
MTQGIPSDDEGGLCLNCIKLGNIECAFGGGLPVCLPPFQNSSDFINICFQKRVRSDVKEHILQIEARLQRLTKLFHHLHPDLDLDLILQHDDTVILNADPASLSQFSITNSPLLDNKPTQAFFTALIQTSAEPSSPSIPEEDPDTWEILNHFRKLSLTSKQRPLYFGKSSSVALLQDAVNLKREIDGTPCPTPDNTKESCLSYHKRAEFWAMPKWLESTQELISDVYGSPIQPLKSSQYQFPDDDLMGTLINNFFQEYNMFYPILHRPTFEKSLKEGLHLTHQAFGGIVLLVCAIGSRHCDDPRVLLDGTSDSSKSNGWKYFSQVGFVSNSVLYTPTLYDLQFYCLAIEFLGGSPVNHSCWLLIGIAIRLAQEVGVHRWRRKTDMPDTLTIEDELWKRAFWTLVSMDRIVSSMLGRTCAIGGDDLDLDLPAPLDGESFEAADSPRDIELAKPCLIDNFNQSIRLISILGTALRTLAASFISAVMLLLNLWTSKRSGLPTNQERDMADVRKCMDHQKKLEKWSTVSGRLWDVLNNLISVDFLQQPSEDEFRRFVSSTLPHSNMMPPPSSVQGDYPISFDQQAPSFEADPMTFPSSLHQLFPFDWNGTQLPSQGFHDESTPMEFETPSLSGIPGVSDYSSLAMDLWMNSTSGPSLDDWGQYLAGLLDGSQSN